MIWGDMTWAYWAAAFVGALVIIVLAVAVLLLNRLSARHAARLERRRQVMHRG